VAAQRLDRAGSGEKGCLLRPADWEANGDGRTPHIEKSILYPSRTACGVYRTDVLPGHDGAYESTAVLKHFYGCSANQDGAGRSAMVLRPGPALRIDRTVLSVTAQVATSPLIPPTILEENAGSPSIRTSS
jgi:hypothetical protein